MEPSPVKEQRLVASFLLRALYTMRQRKERAARSCVECGAEMPEDAPAPYKKEQTCCKECYDLVRDAAEEYYYSRCEY